MKNWVYPFLALTLFNSCAALKRTKQQSTVQESRQSKYETRDTKRLIVSSGSARSATGLNTLTVEILPEGVFEYSPTKGFNGKAKRIKVQESSEQRIDKRDTQATVLNSSGRASASEQASQSSNTSGTMTTSSPMKWWFVLLVLLFVVTAVWYGYRKFFKK